jgi:hypothetical protein
MGYTTNSFSTIHSRRFQNEGDMSLFSPITCKNVDPFIPITRKPITVWPKRKVLKIERSNENILKKCPRRERERRILYSIIRLKTSKNIKLLCLVVYIRYVYTHTYRTSFP